MARQGRNNWTMGGQTLLLLGGGLLLLNIFSTFRSISGTNIDFFTMFFVTIGEGGTTSFMLLAYVWGPFLLIPLGLILFLIGMKKPPRQQPEGDDAAHGFTGGNVQTGVAQGGAIQQEPYDPNGYPNDPNNSRTQR